MQQGDCQKSRIAPLSAIIIIVDNFSLSLLKSCLCLSLAVLSHVHTCLELQDPGSASILICTFDLED